MSKKQKFKFEVNVAYSEGNKGYIASSPQIDGCSAWGPTIEYAVLEFGFSLHLFAETMVENEEIFKIP